MAVFKNKKIDNIIISKNDSFKEYTDCCINTIIVDRSICKEHSFVRCKINEIRFANNISFSDLTFLDCEIKNIDFANLEIINECAFYLCKIENFNLPDTLISIEDKAFCHTVLPEKIIFPNNLKYIGEKAFSESNIKEIKLNKNIQTIDETAFLETGINSDLFKALNEKQKIIVDKKLYKIFEKDPEKEILFKDIEEIMPFAFKGVCLSKSIFPKLLKLNPYSFYRSEIVQVEMSKNITIIPGYCFCKSRIKTFDFSNITEIGFCAFKESSLLDKIDLSNVNKLDTASFGNVFGLTSVNLSKDLKVIPKYCFASCENLKNVTIPNGVKRISKASFYKTIIKKINIPDSVVVIEEHAMALTTDYLEHMYARSKKNKYIIIKFGYNPNLKIIDEHAFVCGCYNFFIPTKIKDIPFFKKVPNTIGQCFNCYTESKK